MIIRYITPITLGISLLVGCNGSKIETRVEEIPVQTNLVHEYLDLDGNGKYEVPRLVYETGKNRVIDEQQDYFNPEIDRKLIESLPLVGNERRYLSIK